MTEKNTSVKVQSIVTDVDRPKSVEAFALLSKPMPGEALKEDDSRGFTLTSIKAAFVLERLNQTFGLLGYGWRYAHSKHHVESAEGKQEVLVEVAFQWRVCEQADGDGLCPPIYWKPRSSTNDGGVVAQGWTFATNQPRVWSEPIFTTGGSGLMNRKGSMPFKDACQGATTNGLTKAASRLGVGLEIFKGENDMPPPEPPKAKGKRQRRKAPPKPKAPAEAKNGAVFLTLTGMQQAAQAEVDRLEFEDGQAQGATVQVLAHKMSALGLNMQPARLIHALLVDVGEAGFSQKRVVGTYNFLLSAELSQDNIDTLNAAAWEAL